MNKCSWQDFAVVMAEEVFDKYMTEIEFYIDDCEIYKNEFICKYEYNETKTEMYGFGIFPEETQERNYRTFEEFANAKVFYGKQSLKDIWDRVSIFSLGGAPLEEMLPYYLD
ncbi:MAG: hypothetical protein FWG65_13055 [Turicibacter sp.]|nr:hypothetical protein [Turicibacter sp.]